MLRQKELDLENTEDLLNSFQHEVHLLSQERQRLLGLQNNLELELETSAQAHKQLAEQKTENEKLKEIIDTLKIDLDEALHTMNSIDGKQQKSIETEKKQDQMVDMPTMITDQSHALVPAPFKVEQRAIFCTTLILIEIFILDIGSGISR